MQNIFELNNLFAILLSYFIGSIPSAIWIGKWFFGIDVRDYGSNNAGATNTFRVIGKTAGFTVLFIDILKGWISVKILTSFLLFSPDSTEFINMQIIVGITAVLGHVFPIYEKFQGGKGVATLMGIILAINFSAAIGCVVIFLLIFIFTNYVSLGYNSCYFFSNYYYFYYKSRFYFLCTFNFYINISTFHSQTIFIGS